MGKMIKCNLGMYCLCLWYWIIPDLCQFALTSQADMTKTQKVAVNLMIAAFAVDILSIFGVARYLVSKNQRFSRVVAVCFVIGGVLMGCSRLVTINDECRHNSSIDKVEQTYCGIAHMSTYQIGV